MKKTKEQKGITLIALIITIVVLMILAAVAINSITNDGIISKAESVKNTYTEAQNEEQKILNYYELLLAKKAWTQNGTTITRGDVTLEAGQKVTIYDGSGLKDLKGNNVEWVVLGAEYGELLLVSATPIDTYQVSKGGETYLKAIGEANALCADYAKDLDATSARSLKVEDINRLTGYNPAKTGNGLPCKYNNEGEYGNKVTYWMSSTTDYVEYRGTNGIDYLNTTENEDPHQTVFIMPNGDELGKDMNQVTLTSDFYRYYVTTLTDSTSDPTIGLSKDSEIYKVLFPKWNTGELWTTLLANSYTYTRKGRATFGLFHMVNQDNQTGRIVGVAFSTTNNNEGASDAEYYIRTVLTVDPDVLISNDGNLVTE